MGAITQSFGLFGATGEVGRAFFDALEEQAAFVGRLRLFASERSDEESRVFRDKPLAVEATDTADFDDLNEAILAVPADVADDLAGRLLAAGVRVWDVSGHLRAHPQAVPLAEADGNSLLVVLDDPLLTVLTPLLHAIGELSPLTRVDLSVLAPVSARGKAGVRELARQAGDLLNGRGITVETWPQQVAFNVLTADGALDAAGNSPRERRLLQGLGRALPGVALQLRQFIVPVFYGAVIDLRWSQADAVGRDALLAACKRVPVSRLHDKGDPTAMPSPVGEGVNNDRVIMSRLQVTGQSGQMTVLADPLRAGLVRPLLDSLLRLG